MPFGKSPYLSIIPQVSERYCKFLLERKTHMIWTWLLGHSISLIRWPVFEIDFYYYSPKRLSRLSYSNMVNVNCFYLCIYTSGYDKTLTGVISPVKCDFYKLSPWRRCSGLTLYSLVYKTIIYSTAFLCTEFPTLFYEVQLHRDVLPKPSKLYHPSQYTATGQLVILLSLNV